MFSRVKSRHVFGGPAQPLTWPLGKCNPQRLLALGFGARGGAEDGYTAVLVYFVGMWSGSGGGGRVIHTVTREGQSRGHMVLI